MHKGLRYIYIYIYIYIYDENAEENKAVAAKNVGEREGNPSFSINLEIIIV